MIKVTVWKENRHEQKNPAVRESYPKGILGAIAAFIKMKVLK